MKSLSQFKNKISFVLIVNLSLTLVILLELYFAYTLLYSNLNPEANAVTFTKIVKIDLSAYRESSNLIQNLKEYKPEVLNLKNGNPFKYSE